MTLKGKEQVYLLAERILTWWNTRTWEENKALPGGFNHLISEETACSVSLNIVPTWMRRELEILRKWADGEVNTSWVTG